jgi:hypothetical protein
MRDEGTVAFDALPFERLGRWLGLAAEDGIGLILRPAPPAGRRPSRAPNVVSAIASICSWRNGPDRGGCDGRGADRAPAVLMVRCCRCSGRAVAW